MDMPTAVGIAAPSGDGVTPQIHKPDFRLGYRGDIEGLRAVAILIVVANHAGWLRGGFVGVDVFFVLSGYLITALLLDDAEQGSIHFLRFYARRFRRLLPALLVMLVGVTALAVLLFSPMAQVDQASAAGAASFWASNFHFAFSELDYFGPSARQNLFLHTWSLGVEEQFYLVWPALLSFFLWRKPPLNIDRLKLAMIGLALASIVACIAFTYPTAQLGFYLMPCRAWQFALGALTLLYFSKGDVRRSWLAGCGIAMVLSAAVWLDPQVAYPGWRALIPSLGTAAILAAGPQTFVARLLAKSPMQAIGHVSYSWYLWHWPLLLFGASVFVTNGPAQKLAVVALSLVIAALSYKFIESPIRRNAALVRKPWKMIVAALAIMMLAHALAVRWQNAADGWMNTPQQVVYRKAKLDAPVIYARGCDDFYHSATVTPCAFGAADAPHLAVLIGDSIAGQWAPAVVKAFDRSGWRVIVLTKGSCPMVAEPFFYDVIGRVYTECTQWRQDALAKLKSLHPDVVVLSSFSGYDFSESQWLAGTTKVLDEIASSAGHIYLLRATPHLPFNGPECLSSQPWGVSLLRRPECRVPKISAQRPKVYSWITLAAQPFRNVSVIDMDDLICPSGVCSAKLGRQIVFRDDMHMTATFARSLAPALSDRMEAAAP